MGAGGRITQTPVLIRLIIMKFKMKMNNRSDRHDINRPRSRRGRKYSKYKKCPSMMMLICIKQHLSNIWSSIHENVKQHGVKKDVAYKKNRVHRKIWETRRNVARYFLGLNSNFNYLEINQLLDNHYSLTFKSLL